MPDKEQAELFSTEWFEEHGVYFDDSEPQNIKRGTFDLGTLVPALEALIASERLGEIESAIEATRQRYDPKSPFANVMNINNQVIVATGQYLLARQAVLKAQLTPTE